MVCTGTHGAEEVLFLDDTQPKSPSLQAHSMQVWLHSTLHPSFTLWAPHAFLRITEASNAMTLP